MTDKGDLLFNIGSEP